jgi:hypothetical protein
VVNGAVALVLGSIFAPYTCVFVTPYSSKRERSPARTTSKSSALRKPPPGAPTRPGRARNWASSTKRRRLALIAVKHETRKNNALRQHHHCADSAVRRRSAQRWPRPCTSAFSARALRAGNACFRAQTQQRTLDQIPALHAGQDGGRNRRTRWRPQNNGPSRLADTRYSVQELTSLTTAREAAITFTGNASNLRSIMRRARARVRTGTEWGIIAQ